MRRIVMLQKSLFLLLLTACLSSPEEAERHIYGSWDFEKRITGDGTPVPYDSSIQIKAIFSKDKILRDFVNDSLIRVAPFDLSTRQLTNPSIQVDIVIIRTSTTLVKIIWKESADSLILQDDYGDRSTWFYTRGN